MKRTLSFMLVCCLLLSCAALFGGCQTENSKEYPVTVGGVTIEKEPKNIVVLSDNFADIISYIGYDVKMVGRSAECDQDYLYVVPTVGSAASPDVAKITEAETDLVIADNALGDAAKAALEEAGVTVLRLSRAIDEASLRERYIDLGTALGGDVTGRKNGEDGYNGLFEMLRTLNTATTDIVRTAAYLYLDDNGQLCTLVKGSLEYKFFSYNGSTNVFANQTEPVVDLSDLRIGSPKYIFYDSPEVLEALAADENLASLNALVHGRACQIEKKSFERQGTSAEEAVFRMLDYIEKDSKATTDEAKPAEIQTAPTAAETATAEDEEPATESDPSSDEDGDEDVIEYTITE